MESMDEKQDVRPWMRFAYILH